MFAANKDGVSSGCEAAFLDGESESVRLGRGRKPLIKINNHTHSNLIKKKKKNFLFSSPEPNKFLRYFGFLFLFLLTMRHVNTETMEGLGWKSIFFFTNRRCFSNIDRQSGNEKKNKSRKEN